MDRQDRPNPQEDDIGPLLRAAGPRQQLPDDMKRRWEDQFRQQLQSVQQQRRRGKRRWVLGLCASLVLMVSAITLLRAPGNEPGPEIRITRSSGESSLLRPGEQIHSMLEGQTAVPGSLIETGDDGLVALKYGAYDLRLNHHTRLRVETDQLILQSGELYASHDGPPPASPLRVSTALAVIRDIGTQFSVIAYPQRTVTTVRRGAVLIETGREELHAAALPGDAIRLTVDEDLQSQRDTVEPAGEHWNWIYASGNGFLLEGHTAYEFLQWSVAESGLQLEFASPGAEILARKTHLHGDIKISDPEQSLQAVLASTDLVAVRREHSTLRVSYTR